MTERHLEKSMIKTRKDKENAFKKKRKERRHEMRQI